MAEDVSGCRQTVHVFERYLVVDVDDLILTGAFELKALVLFELQDLCLLIT